MAWERLSHVALSSAGDTISSGTITAKKNLKVILHLTSTGGNVNPSLRFNSDSGSNYVIRDSDSGGTDDTQTGQTGIRLSQGGHGGSFGVFYVNFEITNISDKEKLCIGHSLRMTQTGAANTPDRYEMASKWTNTSAQITSIQVINGGTGDFAIGSYITVLGATSDVTTDEKTTLSDIPANTRYEETDTRKIYRRVLAPTADFEDNFPSGSESSGWTINNGTNTTFGSGKMTNKNVRTTTNQSVAKSLGVTTSSSAWLLRFKVKRTDSSGSQGRAFVEISNQDQGTGSGSSGLSSLRIQLHDTNGVVIEQVHGGSGSGSASLTSTLSADTDYWIQVIYTGTGATAQVFTDSSYSTPLSGTSTSTATSLTARTYQYFAIRNPDWSSDGDWKEYEFDDIELYDGITSAPSASWKERGTA